MSAQLEFLHLDHTFDAHLVQHLIRLYFTWQNPSLHIVDQHAFEEAQDLCLQKGEKSTFYTEFLVNAMLVIQGLPAQAHAKNSLGAPLVQLSRATRAQIFLSLYQNTSPVGQKPF